MARIMLFKDSGSRSWRYKLNPATQTIFENPIFSKIKNTNTLYIIYLKPSPSDLLKISELLPNGSEILFVNENFDIEEIGKKDPSATLASNIKKIHFFRLSEYEKINEIIELLDIRKFDQWLPLIDENIDSRNIKFASKFFKDFAARLGLANIQKPTILKTSRDFYLNILINSLIEDAAFGHDTIASHIKKNCPALIVASGPSLNKQIETLKKYQIYFNIFCVDTAVPILLEANIQPDFIVALDAYSDASWNPEKLPEKTITIADVGASPKVVWASKKLIFVAHDLTFLKIFAALREKTNGYPTGGSVATLAFSIARNLNINPIILIGQDLAHTNGNDHAEGYLFKYSDAVKKERAGTSFEIEGYYGGLVKTELQLLTYHSWYESVIGRMRDLMVINSTEGGAKIRGTLQIPFLKVCENLEDLHSESNQPVQAPLVFSKSDTLLQCERIEKKLLELKFKVSEAHDKINAFLNEFNFNYQNDINKKLIKIKQFIGEIINQSELFKFTFSIYSQSYLIFSDDRIKKIKNDKGALNEYLEILSAMQAACQHVEKDIEEFLRDSAKIVGNDRHSAWLKISRGNIFRRE